MKEILLDAEKTIRSIGYELINQFDEHGITPGVNGPYNDKETIVRNLSHLIVITSIEVMTFSRKELVEKLVDMGKTLIENELENGIYILRSGDKKDKSNGVIGHAWVMEAFIYLYKALNEQKYIDKAVQIYFRHEFDADLGLWKRPSIEEINTTIDYTLNHQLWFAGISSSILKYVHNDTMIENFEVFLSNLENNITIDSEGLICHSIIKKKTLGSTMKAQLKRNNDLLKRILGRPSYYYKEVGYHIFNLAALARLFLVFPESEIWRSYKFKKLIDKTNSKALFCDIQKGNTRMDISLKNKTDNDNEINIYGFPYNVPGFEMFYLKNIFKDKIDKNICSEYLLKQFELIYDESQNRFSKKCFDKITINYRAYEYYLALEARD